MVHRNVGKIHERVHKIVTGDKSWIYAYEPETKQQSTIWAFEDMQRKLFVENHCEQMVALGITGHVTTAPLEQRCTGNSEWYTTISLEKFEKRTRNHCLQWQCEFAHIGSNQRLFERPKRRIDGSNAAQP